MKLDIDEFRKRMRGEAHSVHISRAVVEWLKNFADSEARPGRYTEYVVKSASSTAIVIIGVTADYILREYLSVPLYLLRLEYVDDFKAALRSLRMTLGKETTKYLYLYYDDLVKVKTISSVLGLTIPMTCTFLLYTGIFEAASEDMPKEAVEMYNYMKEQLRKVVFGDGQEWRLY